MGQSKGRRRVAYHALRPGFQYAAGRMEEAEAMEMAGTGVDRRPGGVGLLSVRDRLAAHPGTGVRSLSSDTGGERGRAWRAFYARDD